MIQLTDISKKFGAHTAVADMNMTLTPGKVMGLIGQNGAGKTTTFRMILNFIEPTSGSILWDDHPITQLDKQRIGFYQKNVVYTKSVQSKNKFCTLLNCMVCRVLMQKHR